MNLGQKQVTYLSGFDSMFMTKRTSVLFGHMAEIVMDIH